MVSEGRNGPTSHLHLPPSTSQQAAFGRAVWVGVVHSSQLPSSLSLPHPSFPSFQPPLPPPPFAHPPPPPSVPLPSPPCAFLSLSTSRRCKPLAGKLEGHPRKCKKKRHLAISQNIISRQIVTALFLHLGLLSS